jgi:hypothetical protein
MTLFYIVTLGDAVFAADGLSPNLAKLSADHKVTWVVDDDIYTDEAEMIMDFGQIATSGLVSVSVRSDALEAVFAMTEANANGARLNVAITAHRSMDGLAVASLILQSAKILKVLPLWGSGRKTLFHVANIDATGQIRQWSDKRPHHVTVHGIE